MGSPCCGYPQCEKIWEEERRRNTQNPWWKRPRPRRRGLGRQRQLRVVTLVNRLCGSSAHRGFHESDNGGPASPAPTRKPPALWQRLPRAPPIVPSASCAVGRLRPPTRRPTRHSGRVGFLTCSSPGQGATRRAPGSFLSVIPPLPVAH